MNNVPLTVLASGLKVPPKVLLAVLIRAKVRTKNVYDNLTIKEVEKLKNWLRTAGSVVPDKPRDERKANRMIRNNQSISNRLDHLNISDMLNHTHASSSKKLRGLKRITKSLKISNHHNVNGLNKSMVRVHGSFGSGKK